jgi:succinylglutamate desuccinylase
LEAQLASSQKLREQLEHDYVEMEQKNETLQQLLENEKTNVTKYNELQLKYDTVLELLGEKEELVLELQADIDDMKTAFRQQLADKYH